MCSVPGFQYMWQGSGLFCFSEGMGKISVHLGFLRVWVLICKLAGADWDAGEGRPCLSFQMLQCHCPPLLLICLKTNGSFGDLFGTPVGLLSV